jgi:hypothetical protein
MKYLLKEKTIKQTCINLALSIGILLSAHSIAEHQLIKITKQGNSSVQTPAYGKTMESVKSEYGAPIEKVSETGKPPITRWIYKDFTVYFEGDIVIHAVLRK